ncbi:MAG: hypothetical protein PUB94_07480 [Oscillospiraceae bacterium]|nr:hypothetical protein [Oscillospiraceae bacterium]
MPTSGGGGGGGFSSGGGFNSGGNFSGGHFNNYNLGSNGGRGPSGGSRFLNILVPVLAFIITFLVIFSIVSPWISIDDDYDNYDSGVESVYDEDYYEDYEEIVSEKEKLETELCNITGMYMYNDADILVIRDPDKLSKAFLSFCDKTGVEPCLYITDEEYDNDELESVAYDKYLEFFSDEGHLLIALSVCGDSYYYHLMVGNDAAEAVLDEEALRALRDRLDEMGSDVEEDEEGYDYTDAVCSALNDSVYDIMHTVEYIPVSVESSESTETTQPQTTVHTQATEGVTSDNDNKKAPVKINGQALRVILISAGAVVFTVLSVIIVKVIFERRNNMKIDEYHSDMTDDESMTDGYDGLFDNDKYDDFSEKNQR